MRIRALYTVEKFVKSHPHFFKCGTFSCLFRNLVVKLSAPTQCKCTGALTLRPIRWTFIYLTFNNVVKNVHFVSRLPFYAFKNVGILLSPGYLFLLVITFFCMYCTRLVYRLWKLSNFFSAANHCLLPYSFSDPHWFQCGSGSILGQFGSGSRVLFIKNWRRTIYSWKIIAIFWIKNYNLLIPWPPLKDVKATGEAFSPQKRTSST